MKNDCIGCGYCCITVRCLMSVNRWPLLVSDALCPELFWSEEDGRYYCRLMMPEYVLSDHYRKEMYFGVGCPSNMNSWRGDVKRRTTDRYGKGHVGVNTA